MPNLSDKILLSKSKQKPKTSSDPSAVLGQIYETLSQNRKEELKLRQKLENFKSERDQEEERRRNKLLELFSPEEDEEKEIEKKVEKKKTKSFLEKLGYNNITGALIDLSIITGVILATTKDAEATEKAIDGIDELPLGDTEEKEEPKEKPTPQQIESAVKETTEPKPEPAVATVPPKIEEPAAPVLVDTGGKPVTDTSGAPVISGQPEVPELPVPTPTPAPPKAEPIKEVPLDNKGLVKRELNNAGFSKKAQSNILANVQKESNFKPRSEEIERYSPQTLFKLFGPLGVPGGQPENGKNKVRFQTLNEATELVKKGPEAVAEVIYGGRMGNNQKGDGYKYRGRGFIQLTGKNNYEAIGKALNIDLINNPDLANSPQIAAKIVPLFFSIGRKKPVDVENIDAVNEAVGPASEKSKEERRQLAQRYMQEETVVSGTKIAQASVQNEDMKKQTLRETPAAPVNVALQTQTTATTAAPQQRVDDRPVYLRKSIA